MRLSRADPKEFMRLVPFDLAGSKAHARELERASILIAEEREQIHAAIDTLAAEVAAGKILPDVHDEDIHSFLERVLTSRLGDLAGKLRAGRSRNDQAANDLKLYLRRAARSIVAAIADLEDALMGQAALTLDTVAPGFTHLQPAQPILFAHHLLAHAQAFARDMDRFRDWDRRNATSPLGAGALAGSALATRPELSAGELGYGGVCENSLDAVGSRDHVAEFLFVGAMFGANLSRLAEELVIWSSQQFGWIEIDDAFATGSSIMPQKKNPDIAELTRGRAARLIGNLTTMLVAIKGLPLTYNRDLSEDKKAAFETIDTLLVVSPAMAGMIRTMTVMTETLRRDATSGFTLATEVADWLARKGVPFSAAHEITGRLVRFCEERGFDLVEASDADLARIDERLTPDLRACLTPEAAIAARTGYGGTARPRVEEQMARLTSTVARQLEWALQAQPSEDAPE